MSITKKIARTNYQRPAQTYQENLTKLQIKEQLKDYKECNVSVLSIGCHIRYFSTDVKTNKKLFRLGGVINKIDPEYRFIILGNGTVSWSVQIANTIFWKKMSEFELKEELKEEIRKEILTEDNDNISQKLDNTDLKKLEKENIDLKKEFNKILKKKKKLIEKFKKKKNEIKKKKEKNK